MDGGSGKRKDKGAVSNWHKPECLRTIEDKDFDASRLAL